MNLIIFIIEEGKEEYYSQKWNEIKNDSIKLLPIKSKRMRTVYIPLNKIYETWGNIIHKSDNLINLIYNQNTFVIIFIEKNIQFSMYIIIKEFIN